LNNTFEEAEDALRRNGVPISAKRVRTISERFAAEALAHRQGRLDGALVRSPPQSDPSWAGERIAIALDGGRINLRTPKRGRRRQAARGRGFHANWREPKIFTVYVLDGNGRRRRDACGACDGTIAGPDRLVDLLVFELISHRADLAAEIVFLADGAPWIWNRIDEVARRAGLPTDRVRRVLDYYHAVEHLGVIAEALPHRSPRQRRRWRNRMKDRLKTTSPDTFIGELAEAIGPRPGKTLRREYNYMLTNRNAIDYRSFLAHHLPIGSGAVESAVRRVINLRLKGAGMFWLQKNAEGFLHLRCQTKSDNWTAFFRRALQTVSMEA
jgi:hypothetical protein